MQTISASALPDCPPEPARLGQLMGRVCRQWRRQVDLSFKDLGLSDATRMPLLVLHDHGAPMRQKDIAQVLCLDASSLVRVLAQLRSLGLVAWSCDPSDRRTKCVQLTPAGQQIAAAILQKSRSIEQAILADLSPDELAVTRQALLKIAGRFDML